MKHNHFRLLNLSKDPQFSENIRLKFCKVQQAFLFKPMKKKKYSDANIK